MIQDALRLTANLHNSRDGKTAFDRQVRAAEKYADNALEGNPDKKNKLRIMEIPVAKKLSKKVIELEEVEKRLSQFNKTREFCSMSIHGEDGAENEHRFSIPNNDNELISSVRVTIKRLLENRVRTLTKEINDTVWTTDN